MRPTDENQHSTRPNLISSPRRGGNEQNILEILERDTVRARGMQAQSRFGWYVSGSVLAVLLVSMLVWLARESPKVQQVEAVVAAADTDRPPDDSAALDSGLADEAPAMSHAPAAPAASNSPAGADGSTATVPAAAAAPAAAPAAATGSATPRATFASHHAAVIDEQHPSSRKQDSLQHLPPIVLATPGLLGAVPPAQPGSGAVVQDDRGATPQKPDTTVAQAAASDERKQPATPPPAQAQKDDAASLSPAANGPAAPEPTQTAPSANPQLAATQAGADTTRSPAAAKARGATRATRTASARSKSRKPARNAGKAKRAAAPEAQKHDAKTDSDVALISAVIQHASTRPACAEDECAAKATPRQ